jgi:hypothetical protein
LSRNTYERVQGLPIHNAIERVRTIPQRVLRSNCPGGVCPINRGVGLPIPSTNKVVGLPVPSVNKIVGLPVPSQAIMVAQL